jgi:HSP20 family protein
MGHHRYRGRRAHPHQGAYRRPKYNVPVNIIEWPDKYEAHVYATGFAKEDIRITVSNDVLYISGRRTPEDDRPNFLLQEYPIKSFERWFELSEQADQTRISARYDSGVLIITVAKTQAATRPDVEVKVE